MPQIILHTTIRAPVARCFNLSRSIDLHIKSAGGHKERAIHGVTTGLIGLGETVTWQARHLGKMRTLTTKITVLDPPFSFTDEMTDGDFRSMRHRHLFTEDRGITVMKDIFEFEAPFGIIGKLLARVLLVPYLRSFLLERNRLIRTVAESDEWKRYIAADAGSDH